MAPTAASPVSFLYSCRPTIRSPSVPLSPNSRSRNLTFPQVLRISCDYSCFEVRNVSYRPPGTEINLLSGISFSLPEKSFGLLFGRSGSGKTTLLHLLAGLSKPTSGSICIQSYDDEGNPNQSSVPLSPERVGIVFQFPERYFVGDTILEEVTFGWPRQKGSILLKEHLASNLQRAFNWVGLNGIPLDKDPHSLSGGFKRRLALAIQLVQVPDLLILDEPLAGLDWKARAEVVKLLKHLKKELTVFVVSHDLKFMKYYDLTEKLNDLFDNLLEPAPCQVELLDWQRVFISSRFFLEDGNGWIVEGRAASSIIRNLPYKKNPI